MANKGTIGILTGGGDVPGLNPAIRAVTIRALREGYKVVGIKKGWLGLLEMQRTPDAQNTGCYEELTEGVVNRLGRTGGTFLHSSRVNPARLTPTQVPAQYRSRYTAGENDLTPEILQNLEFLGIDYLIPVGGDDTLLYALRLFEEGVKIVGIPKTMENDVPGTDYCIGFSTCITRTIDLMNQLRTTAGSHERILVVEVFGRYAGFTALLPTLAGAANRCVIPEHVFDIGQLTRLLVEDREKNPSKYSVVLVSEGARFQGLEETASSTNNPLNQTLTGKINIGDLIAERISELSPEFNNGRQIETISQKLGYIVRGGSPDATDSIVPIAYGNIALDLILQGIHGRMVILKNGRYDNIPIDVISYRKKQVEIEKYYNTDRLRPLYTRFETRPQFIMTGG